MIAPEQLIKLIRQSFIGSEQVYTQGSCIMFYFILKGVYPSARPYWSKEGKHMITKIGRSYYDISGKVKHTKDYLLENDKWLSVPISVAFNQRTERRHGFTTPKRLY